MSAEEEESSACFSQVGGSVLKGAYVQNGECLGDCLVSSAVLGAGTGRVPGAGAWLRFRGAPPKRCFYGLTRRLDEV